MKKKKQKQSTSTTAADAVADDADLKSMIHSQREFLDNLIELIPSRFYLTNDDEDSKPWYKGLSKAAKASLKQQSRENIKLARRNRFDPDGEPSSTLQLLQQQQISDGNLATSEDDDTEAKPAGAEEDNKSVTYEELRQKLRRKIEMLRGNRSEKNSFDRKVKVKKDEKKRKRGSDDDGGGQSGKGQQLNDEEEEEEIIEYGKLKLGDEDEGNHPKKKKSKLSKVKELEKAKKLQEVKRENPTVAEREAWKAAANRAMGVKVHDNPRLIKESMRREKKKKEKNAEKWKERVETQEKLKGERQRKRKENIVGRINEKKTRKIAKREKKLMRPGFEGRKEGYITPK